MIECLVCQEGQIRKVEPEALGGLVQDPQVIVWVDLEAPGEPEGDFLKRVLNFHPLAIEDCLSLRLRVPKLDDFGSYLFLVTHGIDHNLPNGVIGTHEIDIFLGNSNYLVTSHRKRSVSINQTKENCLRNPAVMSSADSIAYHIIDSQVDFMIPPVEEQAQILNQLKRDILERPHPSQLRSAMELEERLLNVRRFIMPELRALQAFSHKGGPFIRESTVIYFQDVQDHLVRLQDMLDLLREMAENNLSVYLSITANRSADFTKALSLVAMLFLPLALVAGIYGMNFKHMPELEWKYGYFFVLGFIFAVAGVLVAFYRKKGWL